MTEKPKSDLKKDFEALWKTTVGQFDEIADVLVKTSQAGKAKLDATMLRRERDLVLARLGELVRQDEGRDRFPEAWRALMDEAAALDARIATEEARFGRVFGGPDEGKGPGAPDAEDP